MDFPSRCGRPRAALLPALGCAATCLFMLTIGCAPRSTRSADTATVSFATEDGYSIVGDIYTPADENRGGLILVHMRGSDRRKWRRFANEAAAQGYMSIAFDLRGHGDTTHSARTSTYRDFETADWLGALRDIEAAKTELLAAGADRENIAIVGASIGANLALREAARDPDIQAVVLVSPGLDYQGVSIEETLPEFNTRPVLLVVAEDDQYAAYSSAKLADAAQGFVELRVYPGMAHGTDLLDTSDSAVAQVMSWLGPIVGTRAATGSAGETH